MEQTKKFNIFKKTFQYLNAHKKLAFLVVLFSFFASLFESFSIGSIIPILQSIMSEGSIATLEIPFLTTLQKYFVSSDTTVAIVRLLLFTAGLILIKNIFSYLSAITINRTSNFIRSDLQINLFKTVVSANMQFFDAIRVGHLVGSVSVYTEKIAEFIFSTLNLFTQLVRISIYVILLLLLSFKLTFLAAVLVALLLPLIQLILHRIQGIGFTTARSVSELHSRMVEMFGNIRLMKLFNTERLEEKRFIETVEALRKNYVSAAVYSNLLRPISEIFLVVLLIGLNIVNVTYWQVDLVAYLPFLIVYLYLFVQVFTQLTAFNTTRGKLAEQYEIFRAYEELLAGAKAQMFARTAHQPARFEKEIALKDIHFAYQEGQPVLKGLNITIPRGSFVALVGQTGAGKSTVVNLLAGLYRPERGQVLVDDVPLNTIDMAAWLRKIGFVSQDIVLFNDSFKNNIAYGLEKVRDEEIVKAAKAAHIHDYIVSLSQGYDAIIGERGVRLSGGQKQRLSIARALIRKPEILILDEATSSLDNETELAVQENIKQLIHGKTIVAIAHRLSTIQSADTIAVVRDGTIVEQGSHQELLAKQGFYSHFYNLQFIT